jgi:hypothetical protein
MKLIETKTLSTAAATIEFTSIPQTFTDLVVMASFRSSTANATAELFYRVNLGLSGYSWRNLYGTGSSVTSNSSASDTQMNGYVLIPGANATANTFGNLSIYIPNYTGSAGKIFSLDGVGENNATAAGQNIGVGANLGLTAAITRLVLSTYDNLVAGSTVSLYGITKGSDGITTAS